MSLGRIGEPGDLDRLFSALQMVFELAGDEISGSDHGEYLEGWQDALMWASNHQRGPKTRRIK